ncbi:hypothetical protein CAC42_473 [Sphaceloma murrayae]|uniref:Galactose oxidase n=1 Tax=Sphaceloma murrayae TaxID=2082308 RepID=A0A2K1R3K7_9PEZI|nr:hypothetical protein CAC42_473 [Sphaceloma murrayae]
MAALTITWTKVCDAAILQRSSHTLTLHDSKVYIFGGELLPRQPRDNTIHTIDLATASPSPTSLPLSTTSSNPVPRVGHATALLNSTIHLFSGRGGPSMSPLPDTTPGSLYTLSLTPEPLPSWTLVPPSAASPSPSPRSYHAFTSNGTDTLYLHAGCPSSGRLSDFWSFHVPTATWTSLPPAPGKPRGGTSIAFAQGRVYRFGGFDGTVEVGGAIDYFDVAAGRWETRTFAPDGKEGPGPRSVAALLPVVVGGRTVLLSLFGEGEASALGHEGAGTFWGDVWGWDVREEKWEMVEQSGEGPGARGWFAAGSEGQGGVVQGGLVEGNERKGDLWRFKIEAS